TAQHATASTLPFCFGFYDDGADLGEVRSIEVQRTASKEDSGFRFRDGKVAHVLADLRVAAAQQRAISGERIDQLEDVYRILEPGFPNPRSTLTRARRGGRFT